MESSVQHRKPDLRQDARSLGEVRVADVMHRGVIACGRDLPLTAVAGLMTKHRVHCVVVSADPEPDETAPIWGVVSDLDLVAAALVRELDEQSAGGSAASPVLKVGFDESVERAAQLMTEHAASHLVVVERSHPVGVLSTLDVAAVLATEPSLS